MIVPVSGHNLLFGSIEKAPDIRSFLLSVSAESVGTAEVEVISLVIDSNAVTSIYGRKRGHRSANKRDQQEKQRADGSLLHKQKRSR